MTRPNDHAVGRIAGVFGIHGELKCDPTSAGRSLFTAGERMRLQFPDGSETDTTIEGVREHKGRLLIRVSGVATATDAQRYSGATFYVDRDRIELDPGEYLDRDLVGCRLFDPAGTKLGTVSRVEHYPSSDMLVVGGQLVPMIREFVKSIDLPARRIVVDLPLGLLDPAQADEA